MTLVYPQIVEKFEQIMSYCKNHGYDKFEGGVSLAEGWMPTFTATIDEAVSLARQTERLDVADTLRSFSDYLNYLDGTWDRRPFFTKDGKVVVEDIDKREAANRKNWQKLHEIFSCLWGYVTLEWEWFDRAGEYQRWAKQLRHESVAALAKEYAKSKAVQPAQQ